MSKSLVRSNNKVLGGVCQMLAERTGWDVNLIRIATAVAAFLTSGVVLVAYIAAWVILPQRGSDRTVLDELVGKGKQAYSDSKAKKDAKSQPTFDPYNGR